MNPPELEVKLDEEQLKNLPQPLVDAMNDPDLVDVITEPEGQTTREMFFRFNDTTGIDLPRGKKLMVVIPNGDQMNLQDVFLGHRKSEQYSGLEPGEVWKNGWDNNGAYTEVLVFDGNTNQWRKWQDPKGHDPIKYAEPRESVEYEKLSDYYGMLGNVKPLAFMLISRGKGDPSKSVVTEHSLELMTHPDMHDGVEEMSSEHCPGTTFADFRKPGGPNRLPRYGGGKAHHQKGPNNVSGGPAGYPGSIALRGATGHEPFDMKKKVHSNQEFLDKNNRLWIKLPPGKKILSLEISAGARWWNNLPHKDLGCKGGRKISAKIMDQFGHEKDHFMKSLNVGPQGVLLGGPTEPYTAQDDEWIMIEGGRHTSYLMGWRIMYEDADGGQKEIQGAINETQNQTSELASTVNKPDLDLDTQGSSAGGTQGAKWVLDKNSGDKFIRKTYEHAGPKALDRCATEVIANTFYRLMGVPAPESHMHEGAVVSREIKGLELFPLNKGKNYAPSFYGNNPDIINGFVTDAWLANWDVFGLDYDNMLKSPDGRMVRVDAGGTMFFRGMGKHKPQFGSEQVGEIETMRNPNMAQEAGSIFQNLVTDDHVKSQVKKLASVMTDSTIESVVNNSGISNAQEIITTLKKRRDWLASKYL